MGSARIVGVLGSLLSLLAAQQSQKPAVKPAPKQEEMVLQVLPMPNLERYDADLPEGAQTAANRLRSLLGRTLAAEGKPERVLQVANGPRGQVLIVRSTQAEMPAVHGVFKQLQQELPLQVRLQCSLVTLPSSVAKGQDLQNGRVVAVDAETVGKLVREAIKNKGTLCNLPEVAAGPMAPFVVEPRKADAKDAPTLRLLGEMLPLDEREVAVAMHLVRGALPVDKTREPDGALLQPVFRLQAGKCALATVVEGDMATVLVVRCVDVAAQAPTVPAGR